MQCPSSSTSALANSGSQTVTPSFNRGGLVPPQNPGHHVPFSLYKPISRVPAPLTFQSFGSPQLIPPSQDRPQQQRNNPPAEDILSDKLTSWVGLEDDMRMALMVSQRIEFERIILRAFEARPIFVKSSSLQISTARISIFVRPPLRKVQSFSLTSSVLNDLYREMYVGRVDIHKQQTLQRAFIDIAFYLHLFKVDRTWVDGLILHCSCSHIMSPLSPAVQDQLQVYKCSICHNMLSYLDGWGAVQCLQCPNKLCFTCHGLLVWAADFL